MKEQIKGMILILGFMLLVYGLCCLAEWLSTVITIEFIAKVLYIIGIYAVIKLIKEEGRK